MSGGAEFFNKDLHMRLLIFQSNNAKFSTYETAIRKQGEAHLVEGYTDVIRMQWLGVLNTVAACGTGLTIDHAKEIKRYTKITNLVFDGDVAGKGAANRAGEMLTKQGLNVGITLLPVNEDPGDFFQMDLTKL